MSDKIFYKAGYKYQLVCDYELQTPIRPPITLSSDWYYLTVGGLLHIDTKSSMRASLVHDCFCQLMKERKLDYNQWAAVVHQFFEKLCREDGMGGLRASIWHWGVRFGQGGNPDDPDEVVVQSAP